MLRNHCFSQFTKVELKKGPPTFLGEKGKFLEMGLKKRGPRNSFMGGCVFAQKCEPFIKMCTHKISCAHYLPKIRGNIASDPPCHKSCGRPHDFLLEKLPFTT